jgi:hypothetical protein
MLQRFFASCLAWLVVLFAAPAAAKFEPAGSPRTTVKVFILAGQSNMEGQAVVDLAGKDYNDGRGTLACADRCPARAMQCQAPTGTCRAPLVALPARATS